MSGEVQPRKRKDKKKRKEDGDQIPEKLHTPILTNNTVTDDVNIHVHKEGGTGGGICAKLVFFVLFSALAVLIGLIITEHRGLTDVDTVDPNSKFSRLFEGWIDTHAESHDGHDIEDSLEDDVGFDDDHDDDHGDDGDDDHDDHEDNVSEAVDETDQQSEEEQDDENDDHADEHLEEDDDDEENEEDEDEGIDEIDDEENDNDEDDDDQSNTYRDDESEEEVKNDSELIASDEDEDNQEVDDHENEEDEDNNDEQEDNLSEENEQEEDEDPENDNEEEEEEDKLDISREREAVSDEHTVDNEDDDTDDLNNAADSIEDEHKSEEKGDDNDQTISEEENDPIINKRETSGEDEQPNKVDIDPEEELKEEVLGSSGMAVKLGVGVALLVVAHLVLVKKWKTVSDDDDKANETSVPKVQDRRNTIVVPPAFNEVEPDIEQVQEDYSDEEDENEDERIETNTAKTKYQELTTPYTRPSQPNNTFDPNSYNYEDDDEIDEQEDEELEEEEEEDGESDDGEREEYDEEEVDDEDEDEELLKRLEARYGNIHKDNVDRATEKIDSDSDRQSDDGDYEYTNITNEDDYRIRKEIDEAQRSVKHNNSYAIARFDNILQKFPSSPRALYGKAMALDDMADRRKSNEILEQAIELYVKILKTNKVPPALYHITADRCINRLRFLGQYKTAIATHKIIIDAFPNEPKYLNGLAVTYLTMNRVEEARSIFKQVLAKWHEDGFALVHYGFILKTTDNDLAKAVRYLEKGIRTKDDGVIDGRFFFHLGDAFTRLGRQSCALKIYEEGTKNNLFLSEFQRSLYNVPRLTAKPWWKPESLPYWNSIKLLSESWNKIKEEGLRILNQQGYFRDESENLKDTGEWKQFELFAREAKNCKRGQTKFSVMHPGTHVWPHCGPTNCRLRVHLGLQVPPNTFIRVAKETKTWKEGELLIFDDSFEHEVWHNGSQLRLILIVDVWHPELTPSERNSLPPI